jgi:hypothetical protein
MHWLIDANNLLHLIPEIMWNEPGQRPLALASMLKPWRDRKKLKITLFFDGGETAATTSLSTIPSYFAGPQKSADQIILEYLRQRTERHGFILVSNDAALSSAASSLGVQVVPASLFLQRLHFGQETEDNDHGWNFSTRKKGPARRLPKNKRHSGNLLNKL